MRDAKGPAEVAARLVELGAVVAHPSRVAALAILAPEVAALNAAVRAIRVREGSVDDTRQARDHAIGERGLAQAGARQANARRAARLADYRAQVERQLGAVAVERAAHHERVAKMTPAEVAAADRAREAFVAEQARQRQLAYQEEHAMRHPIIERGRGSEIMGPSIGF